jgi:hypothetical protein
MGSEGREGMVRGEGAFEARGELEAQARECPCPYLEVFVIKHCAPGVDVLFVLRLGLLGGLAIIMEGQVCVKSREEDTREGRVRGS